MERINRDNYLSILKNFKDQQIIKVIKRELEDVESLHY